MAGCRPAGPLGIGSLLIDDGTLCRSASAQPPSLGLPSLDLSSEITTDLHRSILVNTIGDALRRGAREHDLTELVFKYSVWRSRLAQRSGTDGPGPFGEFIETMEAEWVRLVVASEKSKFDAVIASDVARLSHLMGKPNLIADADDYRYRVRPLYYSQGYVDPADFLEDVHPHKFLNRFDIWVHDDFAERTSHVASILDRWSPGLAASTAHEVGSVLGIQIRNIAGKEALSNHAFGLAIDIDAYSNPHVVAWEVIDTLNWVVAKGGGSFDFGKGVLRPEERKIATLTHDEVMETYNRAHTASEIVRHWLAAHLPRYRQLMAELQAAEKTLGVTKVNAATRLEARIEAAQKALAAYLKKWEAKSPGKVCEPPPPTSPENVAFTKIQDVLGQIAGEDDLRRIQMLYENTPDTKYIDAWEKRGVLTVPLFLTIVLVAEIGLRWGEQYESSKDAMHFELTGKGGSSYFKPEMPLARREKPRTLQRLMEESFGGPETLKLEKPALLAMTEKKTKKKR